MLNKISSGSDYCHDSDLPETNAYLSAPIIEILLKQKALNVLDIGCGNGSLAKDIADVGMNVVGIDTSGSGIENCRKLLPNNHFYQVGIYDDPDLISEKSFDAVVSTEVIEHLYYPRELPRFALSKLRSGGILILTTPYHGYIKNLALSIFNKWDFHHTASWDGGHIKFWSVRTLKQVLGEEGLIFQEFRGCGRMPYLWKSMLIVATKV